MRLYAGPSAQFVTDTIQNQAAQKLASAFFDSYGYKAPAGEVSAWQNSLRAMAQVVQYAGLDDHGVLLEYQLPLTSKRLDCMITGRTRTGTDHAYIVELKQWQSAEPAEGENEVSTWIAGCEREVLHPSAQVGSYRRYLQDGHTAFYDSAAPVGLSACTYLHNYKVGPDDVLLAPKFSAILAEAPLFGTDDVDRLRAALLESLSGGRGMDVLRRVEAGVSRPSKKLMQHVAQMIAGQPQYVLLDEQQVVFDKILARAVPRHFNGTPSVLVVKGGPGTGKSVIAINVMAELLRKGFNAHYATGSRAFTKTLRKILGVRAAVQFKYFSSYVEAPRHELDVLICDEAHRVRLTSDGRFTRKEKRSVRPQVDELLDAAKVVVFLLDDHQAVRPKEIGSTQYLKEAALGRGAPVWEYELEAQFRCSGSDGFVNWVTNTLNLRRTANVLWSASDAFDFRILPDPQSVEAAIRERAAQGWTARMTAGFCWPWSDPLPDGTLVDDVQIGSYRRPWNAKPEAGKLAQGIPESNLWAHDPRGIDQVGCIYTAQGFEFDYVGVIVGRDLVYDFDRQSWIGHPEVSCDTSIKRTGDRFVQLVKNVYRVLLSRGMKGCYVCFLDRDTERFVRSRMEAAALHTQAADGVEKPYEPPVPG